MSVSGRRRLRMPGLNPKQYRTVRKLVDKDVEIKTATNLFTITGINTTAQYFDLSSCLGGSQTYHVYSMHISCGLDDNSSTAAKQGVRVVIGRYRKSGVISSGITMTTNLSSEDVIILYDKMFYIGEYQLEPVRFSKVFKFRNRKIPWLNIKTTSGASSENELFCMMESTEGTNGAQAKLFVKLVYREDSIQPT